MPASWTVLNSCYRIITGLLFLGHTLFFICSWIFLLAHWRVIVAWVWENLAHWPINLSTCGRLSPATTNVVYLFIGYSISNVSVGFEIHCRWLKRMQYCVHNQYIPYAQCSWIRTLAYFLLTSSLQPLHPISQPFPSPCVINVYKHAFINNERSFTGDSGST